MAEVTSTLQLLAQRIKSPIARAYTDLIQPPNCIKDKTRGRALSAYEATCKNWLRTIEQEAKRTSPITFVYRLKNAAAFLEQSVNSILPLANEIVFVDNASSDTTPQIIEKISTFLEGRVSIKFSSYPTRVHSQGFGYAKALSENPAGSLASYYNNCFSLATNDYVFKIDAHKILLPGSYRSIINSVKTRRSFIFMRGYDLLGRHIDFEPLLYRRSSGAIYLDGEFFEQLNYRQNCDPLDIYKGRLYRHSFIHMKSLTYAAG